MFRPVRPVAALLGEGDRRKIVGVLSALYVLSLWVFLLAGPFLVSAATDMALGAALQWVVAAVGGAYLLGMALLVR